MANNKDPILTPAEIEAWKRRTNPKTGKKFNQSDIARIHDVTPQYVSWILNTKVSNRSRTAREEVMDHFPWKNMPDRFHNTSPNQRLRDHMEYMATRGKGMSHDKLQRLVWFYLRLRNEDQVVEYDPDLPPDDGVSFAGGFAYRQRDEADGELIIRVNDHAELTERGKELLRFPPKLPQIR